MPGDACFLGKVFLELVKNDHRLNSRRGEHCENMLKFQRKMTLLCRVPLLAIALVNRVSVVSRQGFPVNTAHALYCEDGR